MNYSSLKEKILNELRQKFPEVVTAIETTDFGDTITSFFFKFKCEDDLTRDWMEIVSAIAFNFQPKLESDFAKWNLYLFFLLPFQVSRDIKYRIENDPISSRKIVIENYGEHSFSEIISDHITNDSLSIEIKQPSAKTKLKKNPIIWEELKKFSPKALKKKAKSNEPYILQTLTAIEKRLKP